jgi:hypothetical protein
MHTSDAAVSDAVATERKLGYLPPDTEMSCACGNGESKPGDCARVYAHDSGGNHLATFFGLGLQAKKVADGSVCVFRHPGATHDNVTPPHCRRLAAMNERNARFWQVAE